MFILVRKLREKLKRVLRRVDLPNNRRCNLNRQEQKAHWRCAQGDPICVLRMINALVQNMDLFYTRIGPASLHTTVQLQTNLFI